MRAGSTSAGRSTGLNSWVKAIGIGGREKQQHRPIKKQNQEVGAVMLLQLRSVTKAL